MLTAKQVFATREPGGPFVQLKIKVIYCGEKLSI
jgi:hypothetical protein